MNTWDDLSEWQRRHEAKLARRKVAHFDPMPEAQTLTKEEYLVRTDQATTGSIEGS